MLSVIIVLSIFLIVSLVVNTVGIWYLLGAIRRLLLVSENLNDLVTAVSNFRGHLKSVYELEAFYGEPVLETLLKHAMGLSGRLPRLSRGVAFNEEE